MQSVKYFILITNREYSEKYIDLLKETGVNRIFTKMCTGTATASVMDILGIEKSEKVMLEGMIRENAIDNLKNALINRMNIVIPGNGIGIFLPVACIGGESAKANLLGDKPIEKKENSMDNLSKLVLIITVVDKGNTELVMDAARSAGATGGTVVKAHGTGAEMAKFFGISISQEKEMVYIVSKQEKRDDIMYAIMDKAGSNTEAHGVSFALPVESVVGIRSFENL